jgi:hypothetical protein
MGKMLLVGNIRIMKAVNCSSCPYTIAPAGDILVLAIQDAESESYLSLCTKLEFCTQ